MKKKKQVVISSDSLYGQDIKLLIRDLEAIAKDLDNGTYDKIVVETDYERDYRDSITSILKIVGTRDENDEEYKARLGYKNALKHKKEEQEREEFNRLKKKFGEEK